MKYLILLSFFSILYGQEFIISEDGVESVKVSRYSGKIYYYNIYDEVKVISKNFQSHSITPLYSLPYFYHNSPNALFQGSPFTDNRGLVYEYNEVSGEVEFLFDADADSFISDERILPISPSGDKVLIYDRRPDFYDFRDSTLYDLNVHMDFLSEGFQWNSNDSSIFYIESLDRGLLLELNIYSNCIDTIINLGSYPEIKAFHFNDIYNCIAYSYIGQNVGCEVAILDLDSHEINKIYDPSLTPDYLDGGLIKDIKFSPDNHFLVFHELRMHPSIGGLYLYRMKTNEFLFIEELSNFINLEWFNNDTIVYTRSVNRSLYGYSIKIATGLKYTNNDHKNYQNSFEVFPNPFNSSIYFNITLMDDFWIKLDVYSINGSHILTLFNGFLSKGKNHLSWNSRNKTSGMISTSIYIVRMSYQNNKLQGSFSKKVLYLK